MKKLFGTDGIRGNAEAYPFDDSTLALLGNCLTRTLAKERESPRIVLGRDSRASGERIQKALSWGIQKAGGGVVDVGVLPTPGVAYLAKEQGYSAGIVISASHNPFRDNGIKVFTRDGYKISDDVEAHVEALVLEGSSRPPLMPEPSRPLQADEALRERYIDHLLSIPDIHSRPGNGASVVLDCANGAASGIAPSIFDRIGARVVALANEPNGKNINLNCGTLHPEALCEAVRVEKADMGIAYDGDADRCILVDEKGVVRDGDYLLALFAKWLDDHGKLESREIVATVMSNIGLERFLDARDMKLIRVDVGDKYVLEKMLERRALIGGEQSGHVILIEHATTGDGILTSLMAYQLLTAYGQPLSKLCSHMRKYPQVLRNVPVRDKVPVEQIPALEADIARVETELGVEGRCLVRYSGTEPILRIMIEGPEQERIEAHCESIARLAETLLG